jgi:hypothetical protein
MADIAKNTDYHLKCTDMHNPIPPTQRPRGYGGVAILWHKDFSPFITRLPDGNERIVAIQIQTEAGEPDICLICAYFPCRGSQKSANIYRDMVTQIEEIVTTYAPMGGIVLAADFNANILDPMDTWDKNARADLQRLDLLPHKDHPRKVTFTQHSGNGSSQIDFITSTIAGLATNICIHEKHPLNTSSHTAVSVSLTATMRKITNNSGDDLTHTPHNQFRWEKADEYAYKAEILSLLKQVPNHPDVNQGSTLAQKDTGPQVQ